MKNSLRFVALFVGFIVSGCGMSDGNTQVANSSKPPASSPSPVDASAAKPSLVTIADGRDESSPTKSQNDDEFVAKVVKAKEAAILKSSSMKCDGPAKAETLGVTNGAFTTSGTPQKAYLYELCRAGRSFGIGGIIIADGDNVSAHYTFGENGLYSSIGSVPDMNKNGVAEIILAGSGTGQGYTESSVSLMEFGSGTITFLGSASTFSDNSGAAAEDTQIKATAYRITAEPSQAPDFFRTTYERAGAATAWTETKKGEKFTLDKAESAKFVKID